MLATEHGFSKTIAQMLLIKNGWNVEAITKLLTDDTNYIEKTFGFKIG